MLILLIEEHKMPFFYSYLKQTKFVLYICHEWVTVTDLSLVTAT